jgi:hypothetical protein
MESILLARNNLYYRQPLVLANSSSYDMARRSFVKEPCKYSHFKRCYDNYINIISGKQ